MRLLIEDLQLRFKLFIEDLDIRARYAYDRDPLLFRSAVGVVMIALLGVGVGVVYSPVENYFSGDGSDGDVPVYELREDDTEIELVEPHSDDVKLDYADQRDLYDSSSGGSSAIGGYGQESSNGMIDYSSADCDSNYSPCVPVVGYDLDCPDIGFMVQVVGYDRHGFDRDGDGWGCESYY